MLEGAVIRGSCHQMAALCCTISTLLAYGPRCGLSQTLYRGEIGSAGALFLTPQLHLAAVSTMGWSECAAHSSLISPSGQSPSDLLTLPTQPEPGFLKKHHLCHSWSPLPPAGVLCVGPQLTSFSVGNISHHAQGCSQFLFPF